MHLFTRVTFGATMFAAGLLGGLALFAIMRSAPEPVVVKIVDEPELPPPPPPEPVQCDAAWMPPGYVQPANTRALQAMVQSWIDQRGGSPVLDPARGMTFVHDGAGERTCGLSPTWLRYGVRDGLRNATPVCCDNVCAFGEADSPKEWLVFRPQADGSFALDAWIQQTGDDHTPVALALGELAHGTCNGR